MVEKYLIYNPMIDLSHIDEQLAKAKEDVAFWEKARAVFLDPRIAQVSRYQTIDVLPSPSPVSTAQRPYGELKRKVLDALPGWALGVPVSTSKIVETLTSTGYVFASKTPAISVNEALVSLEADGDAFMASKVGNTRFWTKPQPKPVEDHHE
jgi:hypothetical protein